MILVRLRDLGMIASDLFDRVFAVELRQANEWFDRTNSDSTGGNFYNTQGVRTGKIFPRALFKDTFAGNTLHRDAFKLLGIKTHSTFKICRNCRGCLMFILDSNIFITAKNSYYGFDFVPGFGLP